MNSGSTRCTTSAGCLKIRQVFRRHSSVNRMGCEVQITVGVTASHADSFLLLNPRITRILFRKIRDLAAQNRLCSTETFYALYRLKVFLRQTVQRFITSVFKDIFRRNDSGDINRRGNGKSRITANWNHG